jgi:hypothetical protein
MGDTETPAQQPSVNSADAEESTTGTPEKQDDSANGGQVQTDVSPPLWKP